MKKLSVLGPAILLASFVQVAHADDGGGGSDNGGSSANSSSGSQDAGAAPKDESFDNASVLQVQPFSTSNSVEP